MLTELALRNFKCFEKAKIRLAPLTLLTGVNGVGKSSVMQSLLLLRQSYDRGQLRGGGLLLDGELLRIGRGADVLYENAAEDFIEIGIKHGNAGNAEWLFEYRRGEDVLRLERGPEWPKVEKASLFGTDFCYLQAERIGPRTSFETSEHIVHLRRELGADGRFAADFLNRFGADSLHVIAKRSHPRTAPAANATLREQVELWMGEISPGIRISCVAQEAMDTISLRYSFARAKDVSRPYRATNVGFGLTYTLPIVVALLSSNAGGLVLIENPEAHLHPRGQTKIAELICRAVASGVQVIIESHSDHILNSLRVSVRNKLLCPEDVALHFFSRGEDGMAPQATIESPSIDSDGRLSEWPKGFFDEMDVALEKLISPPENDL